jgi:crossover junction endodeoxyribonuclease RuvC
MTLILGIDPGSRITGYGLIKVIGTTAEYVDSGCIKTSPTDELCRRLLHIYDGICMIMDEHTPSEVAIEQVFMHENPSSALKLGHARGVAMVAAASHRVPIFEYSPREIKQAVVGFGAAEKSQISVMVVQLLNLCSAPQQDAADALAIAICHSHSRTMSLRGLGKVRKRRRSR